MTSKARGPCGELNMYTSGWVGVGILRAGFAGGAETLPWLGVLVVSGVAVLLRGTVDPGLLGTVTPGVWIGCRGPFKFRLAREAPDALRCIALVIRDVASLGWRAVDHLFVLWLLFHYFSLRQWRIYKRS